MMLAGLGLTPTDLLHPATPRRTAPTFAEFIPIVEQAVSPGSRRVYGTYWNKILHAWGERRLDEIKPSEIQALCGQIKAGVVVRANARGGRGAVEHTIAALRCLYRHAVADELIDADRDPSRKVDKPRRLASTRRALPDDRVEQILRTASTTGNDPALDALILRLHVETACRRGGALALRPQDLDAEQCLVRLREKGETTRWQPVSPTLMEHLLAHAQQRGDGDRAGQLLRYAWGDPITTRRYDHLWARLGRALPWVRTQQISTHWLRHTTLTWVERQFGFAVAKAYAGHTGTSAGGPTGLYVRATLAEVTAALAALTGELHPLAPR
ncbi:Phage integrase family protein [Goodfellowiella coeruleoviolacea]|uniref:Phage integrase family protein n=2 Tax=Goodfellowiella coeruleoviolacea TaxID=334858 RepID=A0AAE3GKQ6_9PSEU|nr:site-specific integrase [Goodfellowiella coeruleoviolacea]MCP2167833.1 Phage integrase family protein [Goodfellowiella coeruleoviolacea]